MAKLEIPPYKKSNSWAKNKKIMTTVIRNDALVVIDLLEKLKKILSDYFWLVDKFGRDGKYEDISGLCRVASREEIAEKNYSLTPGAYVGVAAVEDDGVDFAERMTEIHQELLKLQAESNELMQTISKNLKEMGL